MMYFNWLANNEEFKLHNEVRRSFSIILLKITIIAIT